MAVDPNIRQQVMEILSDPMNLPSELWAYDVQNWVKEAPVFPISQVFGFAQFTANTATAISTLETTTSLTYTDLATVGPTLTSLPDGNYLFLYGAQSYTTNGSGSGVAFLSLQVNATTATDIDSASSVQQAAQSVMMATSKSLSNNGSSTVTMKYRQNGSGDTASFERRWLIGLKYSNL